MVVDTKIKEILQEVFGLKDWRYGQADAVQAVLSGRDSLVVMPTGAGKSLCYQLPALCLPGVTIVVSPLIALMKDQVDVLLAKNLPATFINSTLSSTEITDRLQAAKTGQIKLLYVAPERFYDARFLAALSEIEVSLFAVDEAHCISEWGHDFRPSYLSLGQAINKVGRPPIVGLTATATPDVRDDIVKHLGLKDPSVFVAGFDRPNINFGVIRAGNGEKLEHILRLLQKSPGSALIYAGTRDSVDSVNDALQAQGLKSLPYHAGLTKEERDYNQDQFMFDKVRVMVATNAFGLGIDKANIRMVIHLDMPGTLEAYYQEAGRVGRDGQPSYAVLMHHPRDRYLREFFLEGENPAPDLIKAVYQFLTYQAGEIIYVTIGEILEGIAKRVPELAVSTSLKHLERGGYISRTHNGEAASFVKLSKSINEVNAGVHPRAKIQYQVWQVLRDKFGDNLLQGLKFGAETIVQEHGLTREALTRSLKALADKGFLIYEPPFRGQEIKIEKRVAPRELALDWTALSAKRQRETDKLNFMERYVYTPQCRRHYILKYFGDSSSTPYCTACDNCL
jgi:ATP-dependent DNA helicase RecQ